MAWTTPATASTGQLITAAFWNAQIPNNMNILKTSITDDGRVFQLTQTFRGLHLRSLTDPSDQTAVGLYALDNVIMDDFVRYSAPTLPITADLAVTGAGGIDTGVAAVSTWYDIYLIGKSGTKANSDLRLMFHLSDATPADTPQANTGTSEKLRQASNDRVKLAQGIKTSATGTVPFVDVTLQRTGTVTSVSTLGFNMFWFTIETDNAGSPSGTPVATSDKYACNNLSTSAQQIRVLFRSPPSLTSGTQYHLVLNGDYDFSGTNYLSWIGESSNTYAGGVAKKFDGSVTWAAATPLDFTFSVHRLVTTAVTMPSGYDEKCKLGSFYSGIGLNPTPFVQRERVVVPLASKATGTYSAVLPTLFDLSAIVPPGPMSIRFAVANVNGSGAQTGLAPVPDGFDASSAAYGGSGRRQIESFGSSSIPNGFATLITETQAIYLFGDGTNAGQLFVDSYEFLT